MNNKILFLTAVLAVFMAFGIYASPALSADCEATLSSDLRLHVPVLSYGNDYYWADFNYKPQFTENIVFGLSGAGAATGDISAGCRTATLSSGDFTLHLPYLSYNGLTFKADLKYAPELGTDGESLFKVVSAEVNEFSISSTAFQHNGHLPIKYSCKGQDISPPLTILDPPSNAVSLALLMDDPDASSRPWVHWVLWNIPPTVTDIAENSTPQGALTGKNDWNENSYGGPCPPSGTHRYYFKLYALDKTLTLTQGATKSDLENAMSGHILSQTEIIALYP